MSAGMADIIAAHGYFLGEGGGCRCGKWSGRDDELSHYAHVAEELAKAGYGSVQEAQAEALREAAEVFGSGTWSDVYLIADVEDDADAARATADWLQERAAALTPDPLAAALADPEGHALVTAIHDRKAEG